MKVPADTIAAPPFPLKQRWLNSKRLTMDQLRGNPVLIEFWDFCRPNSIRTLPYMRAWHKRYGPAAGSPAGAGAGAGAAAPAPARENDGASARTWLADGSSLQVIGVHSPGFQPSKDERAVEAAVARLEIDYPVLVDSELEMWRIYENLGWPARYLFDREGFLFDYHYGEGAYQETEIAIQALLSAPRGKRPPEAPDLADFPDPLAPIRPEDAPEANLAPQTADVEGPYSGRYEAGGVWAVLDGAGTLLVSGEGLDTAEIQATAPGAYPLVEHDRHTRGTIEVQPGEGVQCLATCFTPGVAP